MARPTRLNDELTDELVKWLKLGCYVETAAAMCGLDRNTFQTWVKRGAREKERREKYEVELETEAVDDKQRQRATRTEERKRRDKRRSEHNRAVRREERYVAFHSAVEKAAAQAELQDLATIGASAKGGHVLERRVIKNEAGGETTFERRSKPEWQAAAWRLERRNPRRWARVQRIEVTGDEEKPVALSFADLARSAAADRNARSGNGQAQHVDADDL